MAAVAYSAGTSQDDTLVSEFALRRWISPSTMDSADTVILPTRTGKTPVVVQCWDTTTGDAVTATISTQTCTIDAAGGTTDHVYVLYYSYI